MMEKVFKKLRVSGDKTQGFYGSVDIVKSSELGLKCCPLCRGENQELHNTTTPIYWITCGCGIELHSYYSDESGAFIDADIAHISDPFFSKEHCFEAHKEAIEHIVKKWNRGE